MWKLEVRQAIGDWTQFFHASDPQRTLRMTQFLGFGGWWGGRSEKNPGRVGKYFQFCDSIAGQDTKPQGLGLQKGISSGSAWAPNQLSPQPYCSVTGVQSESQPVGSLGLGAFCCCPWPGGQCWFRSVFTSAVARLSSPEQIFAETPELIR